MPRSVAAGARCASGASDADPDEDSDLVRAAVIAVGSSGAVSPGACHPPSTAFPIPGARFEPGAPEREDESLSAASPAPAAEPTTNSRSNAYHVS